MQTQYTLAINQILIKTQLLKNWWTYYLVLITLFPSLMQNGEGMFWVNLLIEKTITMVTYISSLWSLLMFLMKELTPNSEKDWKLLGKSLKQQGPFLLSNKKFSWLKDCYGHSFLNKFHLKNNNKKVKSKSVLKKQKLKMKTIFKLRKERQNKRRRK